MSGCVWSEGLTPFYRRDAENGFGALLRDGLNRVAYLKARA